MKKNEFIKYLNDINIAFKIDENNIIIDHKGDVNQYRLLTGACLIGIKDFLRNKGLNLDSKLSISEAKEEIKGYYGYDRFVELIG